MPFVSFSNFKGGLDTRRSALTSQAGTLQTLQDCHVNEGAEIEIRKAFINASYAGDTVLTSGTLIIGATYIISGYIVGDDFTNVGAASNANGVIFVATGTTPTIWTYTSIFVSKNTYGLETSANGLLVFGSGTDPGGWYNNVSYQRLQHPGVLQGARYDITKHLLVSVPCSTSYGGFAWVVATFSDGLTFVYQNAVPIDAWVNGTVLSGWTSNQNLAVTLSNTILSTLNTLVTPNWFVSTPSGGTFTFWSSVGLTYSPVITDPTGASTVNGATQAITSGAGTLSINQLFNPIPPQSGVSAIGSFFILEGSTGGVAHVYVNGVDILGGAVNFSGTITTAAQLATAVAAQISAYIASPLQYTATANTNSTPPSQVIITAVNTGITLNGYVVKTVVTGNVIIDNVAFTVTAPSSGVACSSVIINGSTNLLSGTVTASGTNYNAWYVAIAANITAYSGSNGGYVAYATGLSALVMISKLTRLSSDTLPNTYTVTTTSGTPTDGSLALVLNVVTSLIVLLNVPSTQQTEDGVVHSSQVESLNISGGTAPYTYYWFIQSDVIKYGGSGVASLSSTTAASVTVNGIAPTSGLFGVTANETIVIACTVTDSSSPKLVVTSPTITITNY
jgi:hypothetical protein